MPRPSQKPDVPMTEFAQWLSAELARRNSSQPKLAAAADIPRQTVNAWFNSWRIPGPDLCRKIAEYLHLPVEEVLIKAGHLPADHAYTQPDIPGWLTAALEGLEEWELRVVASTARGLREARQDPSLAEVRRQQSAPADR